MIRPTTTDDMAALIALADSIGFEPNQLEELTGMLADYLDGKSNSDRFWLTDDDDGPVGVVYCASEPMTQGTWNLLLIAVRPDCQGQGQGRALMRYVEETLTARGARLLLVETSGLASFDRTRAFYRKCGYSEPGSRGRRQDRLPQGAGRSGDVVLYQFTWVATTIHGLASRLNI